MNCGGKCAVLGKIFSFKCNYGKYSLPGLKISQLKCHKEFFLCLYDDVWSILGDY